MAASIVEVSYEANGAICREWIATFTGDTSYATGGYLGLKETLGISEVFAVVATPLNVASQDYDVVWTNSTGRIILATEGAEVANTTNVSGVSFTLLIKGT